MSEITAEQVREVLDLEIGSNDSGKPTVRAYLVELLRKVWTEGEGFDGKRPFGNSSWDYDIKVPMVKAGLITGNLDRDGDVIDLDDEAADMLILAAIQALDAPGQHAEPEPAKVIVVTEIPSGPNAMRFERRYAANVAGTGEYTGTLRLLREGTAVAEYQPHGWLSWREEGVIVNDGPADKRKLGIALDTLREMQQNGDEAASEALAQIADVDL